MSARNDQDRLSLETRAEMERTDRKVKIGLLAVSSLTIGFLAWAALTENVFAKWRLLRKDYKEVLEEKADDDFGRSIARAFNLEVDQNVLLEMGEIDRCISCHTGIDDPRMQDAPQPFTTHPGRYAQIHPPATFGCTICHEGQGRASTVADAHGRVPFWDHPMLEKPYMKSGCTKCHAAEELFGTARLIDKADDGEGVSVSSSRLDQGWRLMEEKGCLGCHTIDGKGGSLGPDLTRVGDKSPHEFAFAHLDHVGRDRLLVTTWLEEHFLDPKKVSPGTLMPDVNLDEQEAEELTAVMLSLRSRGPASLRRMPGRASEKSGGELYALYCSACHGPEGRGNAIAEIHTPSLNNDDVLSVADDDYLRRIISSGRRGTHMPGWGRGLGGLSHDEINRVVAHLRSWQAEAATPADVRSSQGDPRIGRAYYQGLCANCHGDRGEGGIGTRLSSPSFLAIASDRFLAETIIQGRPGTAMSSWKLPTQAVADIIAWIRTWQAEPPSFQSVKTAMTARPRRRLVREGRQLYGLYCSSCHGKNGEGGIGLNLRTPDLLRAVDDRFLYRAIVEGRPTTGMPSWRHLQAQKIAAILSYVRSWQKGPPLRLARPARTGDHISGEAHYVVSCQRCHGERGSGGTGPQIANPVFLSSVTDAQLFHWIGKGRSGTAMKGFLPEAQGVTTLAPEHIADVIAYLRYVSRGGDVPLRRIGAGDAVLGARLFAGTCGSCHGAEGQGTWVPQLNNPNFLKSASDGFLAATIVLGREGTAMRAMVHGQQGLGQIDPDQVRDVIAYMRLWEDPQAWRPPVQAAELSEQAIATGRELYAGYCAGCHGPNGRGVQDGPDHYAPALNNQDFLAAASDGFLLATIARGRRGTPMRPFGEGAGGIVSLAPERISDIVSYIRSWQKDVTGVERHASAGGTVP